MLPMLRNNMNAGRTILMMILVLAMHRVTLMGQESEAIVKLRLAQSFERAGDWERAVPIYESLLLNDPRNYVYFEALRRGYVQLREYDKAVELIEYRLTLERDNPQLLAALGSVYYQMGKESTADSLWQAVVGLDSKNPSIYRLIAGQMMEFRLYDRAIDLFLRARKITGDPNLFLSELANLYGAFQQYDRAAEEFVQLLLLQPGQLSDIQSRMSVFLGRPEAIPATREVIARALSRHEDLVPLRQLHAWVLMEEKRYDAALEQYRVIDRAMRARGAQLFTFAGRAMNEGEYRIAASACDEALKAKPPAELVPLIRLGYARAIEELTVHQDTTTVRPSPQGPIPESALSSGTALRLYASVAKEYSGTQHAAQAYFRMGILQRDRFRDLDAALAAFDETVRAATGLPLAEEALLERADVLVAKNDLEKARATYMSLSSSRSADMRNRALFHLAELDYYTAQFDSALAVLNRLAAQPGTDLANDALSMQYFIEENQGIFTEALKAYASAELLRRQKRDSEALEVFRSILRRFPTALLADDAAFTVAEILVRLRRYDEAVQAFREIAKDMPSSILRDLALMRMGEVYETNMHAPALAIETYEELLKLFPGSIHAEEARKRIRLLRGDVL